MGQPKRTSVGQHLLPHHPCECCYVMAIGTTLPDGGGDPQQAQAAPQEGLGLGLAQCLLPHLGEQRAPGHGISSGRAKAPQPLLLPQPESSQSCLTQPDLPVTGLLQSRAYRWTRLGPAPRLLHGLGFTDWKGCWGSSSCCCAAQSAWLVEPECLRRQGAASDRQRGEASCLLSLTGRADSFIRGNRRASRARAYFPLSGSGGSWLLSERGGSWLLLTDN